ncbi:MAG: hypothetical protein JRH01_11565 [Deltaproteobacteria bacterium]|nr:hypothetical protein [Deltaproteobacteria bacterium]MBW2393246.1 hypothetical protein [Deltaproteobacteria bacterium]
MQGGNEQPGPRPFFTRTRRRKPWARWLARTREVASERLAKASRTAQARSGSHRRMTLRGRLTIAAASLLLLLGVAFSIGFGPSGEPEATPPAAAESPPVASKPPPLELSAVPQEALEPPVARGRLEASPLPGKLRVEYTLDRDLTRKIWKVLDRGRVELGHVLVMDAQTGEMLAYVSTDPERFPPGRAYPAASLVKVVTAAALLDKRPSAAQEICHFAGDPYRLRRRHLDPPKRGGNEVGFRKALVTSNNKCFAQYAVHRIGRDSLVRAIDRFGFLSPPAKYHVAGQITTSAEDRLELGELGSGLDGLRITPLHAVQLAGVLAHGNKLQPRWVARIEAEDGALVPLGPSPAPVRVLTSGLASDLRKMLVDTTRRGTARKAFRTRRGHPLLKGVNVAGKTGSLNGTNPKGRYEWFIGVAPAEAPRIAVATVAVQGPLFWMSGSQLAAEVFKVAFCPKGVCSPESPQERRAKATANHPVGG